MKQIMEIEVNETETKAIVDGETAAITTLCSQDHGGHEWLYIDIEGHGEFISYDEGKTWW